MQLFLATVVAGVLVVSWIVIRRKLAQDKGLSLAPALPQDNEEDNANKPVASELARILVIEHVPAEIHRADIGGLIVSDAVRAELLEAGLVLVKKLPSYTCGLLSSRVFKSLIPANFSRLLSKDESFRDVSPERVRATVAIAIVSLSLQDMMMWSGEKVGLPNPLLVERHTGIIWAGLRIFHIEDIILQIILGTDVSHDVATDIWLYILEILQEGNISIPGIKARPALEGEIF